MVVWKFFVLIEDFVKYWENLGIWRGSCNIVCRNELEDCMGIEVRFGWRDCNW